TTPTRTATPTATPTASTTRTPTATATGTSSGTSLTAGSRIPWRGKNWYLHGANVPWYNWACDFGCNGNGGVSSSAVQSALSTGFGQAKAAGMHVIRWWVFPGDPWQITRDSSGAPSGINPAVYADFDVALQLAQTYDLYFNFVLFSGPTALPQAWLTDATQRQKLATALGQLFARYKGNPRVLSWEVFNEPEWDIWNNKISQSAVQATVKAVADAVHANSTAYVTVGSAMLDGLPMWVGQGLDYYQAHWYDYMSSGNWCARCTDYATVKSRYNLDKPLVIGEFYAGPDTDALQRFEDFYSKGYAGAWPWSLFPDRTSDHMQIDLAAAATFASRHSDLGPTASSGSSTPTATATRTPTATATPQPSRTPTPTPTGGGMLTITFDDYPGQDQPLSGQYPTSVIDWGSNQWWISGPWGKFTTKSVSFNGGGITNASFKFVSPRKLVQIDASNGGSSSTTVTLTCDGKSTKTVTLAAGQVMTILTGWTKACTTVTVTSTNGWDTNFDNLVLN
ncbi:MAG: hypothetical protein C4290_06540, partial [Chloroflexota bacterium]